MMPKTCHNSKASWKYFFLLFHICNNVFSFSGFFYMAEQQYHFQDDLLLRQVLGIMKYHKIFVWAIIFVIITAAAQRHITFPRTVGDACQTLLERSAFGVLLAVRCHYYINDYPLFTLCEKGTKSFDTGYMLPGLWGVYQVIASSAGLGSRTIQSNLFHVDCLLTYLWYNNWSNIKLEILFGNQFVWKETHLGVKVPLYYKIILG